MRRRRRSQHQAVFEREVDKSLEAHEHLMDQWDRGSSTCNKCASGALPLVPEGLFSPIRFLLSKGSGESLLPE